MSQETPRAMRLSGDQRQLLDLLLAEDGLELDEPSAIRPRQDPAERPLSFAQQRLWFLDQLAPGSAVYNVPSVQRLSGALDAAALARALAAVWRRHEGLRSVFPAVSGVPAQRLLAAPLALPVVDLSGLPRARRDAETLRLATTEARRPFSLERGPLLRAALLHLDGGEHVLLLTMHHIVSDGWSRGVLVRELVELYTAEATGRPASLPPLPIQYADFAVWQRQRFQGAHLEEVRAYWRRQLAGLPRLELPGDRPRPPVQSFRGGHERFAFGAAATEAARRLARQSGSSLFMVLLTAFQILLHRYSGQTDVAVGTPLANRERPELAGLIGFLVNTVVLRASLADGPAFTGLLERVRATVLEAHSHAELPFEMLVEDLAPERNLSHTPLVQVMFSSGHAPAHAWTLPGLSLVDLEVESGTAKFDLNVFLMETGTELVGWLEHSSDLFDGSTVRRLAGHFGRLLEAAVAYPLSRVGELPLLSAAERHQIVLEWGGRGMPEEEGDCLHRRFASCAARTSDAVAVVYEGEHLSYGELARRAGRLALTLAALGVGPEVKVGVRLERSLEMVVAILGVLEAGGAYVPLDPAYPAERIAWMIEDARTPVLVTRQALLADLPDHHAATVCLDAPAVWAAETPACLAGEAVVSRNTAYVIYTSGSTGRPKGVLVPHANVVCLFAAARRGFDFGAGDVWTLFHSYAFDFSVWEIWGALLAGGRLVVVPQAVTRSPEAFRELLGREGVTVLNQTPSAFRQLVRADEQAGEAAPPLALRHVVFGGEALELSSLRPWFDLHGDRRPRLVNMYGITETTVHVTFRALSRDDLTGGSVVGRALPHLELYVLDRGGELVPAGVAGELHVGGEGLARGYLNRPELTAERFLPSPFGEPGARLYRSGDLGRFLRDGDIEYLGRRDHQVKVRGFRIELGEIEAALVAHPEVREAVVLALAAEGEAGDGSRRLVAYLVPGTMPGPGLDLLRSWLRERLPEYMLPAAYVTLPSLPLTPEGKVDRRALPAPGPERPELAEAFAVPRTLEEEILAAVWAQVLGLDRVGLRDNFFSLGGDSILSVQVVSLARERGLDLTLQDLFLHQTVDELAGRLVAGRAAAKEAPPGPFDLVCEEDRGKLPTDLVDAYPLTHLQSGMLFHMELTPDSPAYHNVTSFHLRAPCRPDLLQVAVDRVVARHPVLRTSFEMTRFREPLQLVHRVARLPVWTIDLRALDPAAQEAAVDAYLESERRRLFDLACAPLLRLAVHQRGKDVFQLTVTENHAIFDGWSLHSTLTEIFDAYLALVDGELVPEPAPLASSFREFVALERAALASQEARSFLLATVAGYEPPELPGGFRGDGPRQRVLRVPVSGALYRDLCRAANAAALPRKSLFLAAHLAVVGLLTGRSDVLTGVVSHGRPETRDGEQVRGLFLNTLPLRVELRSGTWHELARRVFEAERDLIPFRRYPLAALQRELGDRPLVETAFNYIHFHVAEGLIRSRRIEPLGFKATELTNFALAANFRVSSDGEHLTLDLEHDAERIGQEHAAALGEHYLAALAALARGSETPYEPIGLLTPAQRHQLLVEWNDSRSELATGRCLHHLVAEQAFRRPEAVALVSGEQHLSYGELACRADRLARGLRHRGVGPDRLVGICAERSPEMVVGVLGVLLAGGAYVPMDPEYPRERLSLLLADARPEVLLSQARLRHCLPDAGVPLIWLDQMTGPEPEAGGEPMEDTAAPDNLAYVIYTSGSTGRPKAVMIRHQGVVHRVLWAQRAYPVTEEDRVLQKASFSFDVSVWEIFGPLAAGGCLVLSRPGGQKDTAYLSRTVLEEEITLAHFVPSLLPTFIAEADVERCASLRYLFSGGEALPLSLALEVVKRLGPKLRNQYGPTEITIDNTDWLWREEDVRQGAVPLGRPLSNTTVHLLADGLDPVPVGVGAELCVGGIGVARGYLRQPALTAERFVPDRFGEPGSRLYRTGDLARRRVDGNLEFLGRLDHQVKLRGFRIELGEIQSVLASHPGVREAAVLAREDVPGDRRLVAYWSPAAVEGAAPEAGELRSHLKERLPEHMVPEAFVLLEALPLTVGGKLDRAALPAPARMGEAETGFTPPRTPLEEVVANVWAELLGRAEVGAHDDFFELGGHSLLASQAVARLRRVLGLEVPLRQIFEAPTAAGLAARVESLAGAAAGPRLPAVEPTPRLEPVPLSFLQEQLWFMDQLHPGSAVYNLPAYARFLGPLSPPVLERCLDEIVARQEALRTRFVLAGGLPVQVVDPPRPEPLPMVDLSGLGVTVREAEASLLASAELLRPFDLARGPLFRRLLVRLATGEHALLLTLHHVAGDGWSMGVLLSELAALYEAFAAGRPSSLAPLPVQYADFAQWQLRHFTGEVLDGLLGYWTQRLGGGLPVLRLPFDRPRPAVPTFRGGLHPLAFSPELTQSLEMLSREEGVTLYMTLLAAYVALLHARSGGQLDILVGTPVAGRGREEIEGLIGLFLNTLVLRTDLSGDPTFRDLLGRVREVTLGAYAHQELPFEKIIQALGGERDPGRTPLYQVWFNFMSVPMPAGHFSGLTLAPMRVDFGVTKFDLALNLRRTSGGLHGSFEYAADLFEPTTVEGLATQLEALLVAVVERRDAHLGELAARLSAVHRRQQEAREQAASDLIRSSLRTLKRKPLPKTAKG